MQATWWQKVSFGYLKTGLGVCNVDKNMKCSHFIVSLGEGVESTLDKSHILQVIGQIQVVVYPAGQVIPKNSDLTFGLKEMS